MSDFYVRVTNNNTFPISDRHAGVEYTFLPGRALKISADAAQHILGYIAGESQDLNRSYMQKRWGWNTPTTATQIGKFELSKEWLDNISIETVAMTMVEVPPELSAAQVSQAIELARVQPPDPPFA